MGKPAARLTDMTAHGGTIVGPGAPTVLIGKMPAATLLDNHVCPMVTGVVPHVGGPMTLGSMGVFIGKKPAGRMGDMKVCVGPPSQVMMGCFTVLIGEAGGGGGGSAGSAAAAEAASLKSPASIEPFPVSESEPGTELHTCSFQFTDSAGMPLAGIPFLFKGPDNLERKGASGPGGEVLYSGFAKAGSYKVQAMALKDAKWSKAKAAVGEKIKLTVTADGFEDGASGALTILKKDDAGGRRVLAQIPCKVKGKKLEAEWTIDVTGADEAPIKDKAERKEEYCQFIAHAGGSVAVSGKLEVHADLDIELVDEIGQPIEKQKIEVILSNGEVKELNLDAQGKARLPQVPANTSLFSIAPAAPAPTDAKEPDSYLDSPTDLKKGCRDAKGEAKYKKKSLYAAHGSHVTDLQQDLNDLGFPINGLPDGDFGGKTESAVKVFQAFAKTVKRRMVDGEPVLAPITFTGSETGIVDPATKDELKRWKEKKYARNEVKIYVKRKVDGVVQEVPVDGPEHLRKKDGDKGIKGDRVIYAKGIDGKEIELGNQGYLQGTNGIGNFGTTSLYQALVKPASLPGIPGISDSKKRVWASIWRSEGALEAINLYDSAFLSFGPIQQTMGAGNEPGELGGALYFVKNQAPDTYNKFFGGFGLDPEKPREYGRIEKGHFQLDGNKIDTAAEKSEYRRFIWGFRFTKAMSDEKFRKYFLEYGFKRLDLIEEMKTSIDGNEIHFKDIFKSELARALLLDAHINGPAWVDSDSGFWVKAVKKVKTNPKTKKIDVTAISSDEEFAMIKEILSLRASSRMWDPNLRAGFIILCCKGFEKETSRMTILEKLGFDSVAGFLATIKPKNASAANAGLSQTEAEKYYYSILSIPEIIS